jgi:hypothetical protein
MDWQKIAMDLITPRGCREKVGVQSTSYDSEWFECIT